jgi:mono/diheme cytochrome c family protein
MERNRIAGSFLLAAVAVVAAFAMLTPSTPSSAQSASAADVAQGKYLVEGVGFCLGCHGQNLMGQPAPANNPNAIPYPRIAGLPQFANDADAIKFFETGLLPDGARARPPMRQFRFKHSDAVALTAYLRSLPTTP